MQASFGDKTVYQNHERLKQLHDDVEAEKQQLDILYQAWEYRVEQKS
jgi:hypothetical protein